MPADNFLQADGTPQEEFVCVGQIVKVRGTGGELEVFLLGGTALRLEEPSEVFLEDSEGAAPKAFTVVGRKRVGKRLALELEGVDAPEIAEKLIGHSVMVNAWRLPPLPEGQYYHYQIVGLDVVDGDGASLGRLEEVLETGGNDVYVVRAGENEILVPATDDVVKQVDLDAGRIVVELPPGLVE
jgi:16S rRNA processing protein RimM